MENISFFVTGKVKMADVSIFKVLSDEVRIDKGILSFPTSAILLDEHIENEAKT